MENTISCLLTTHNKEDMIEAVCHGILDNISNNVEQIIVVFDGCYDNTEKIVKNIFKNFNKKLDYVYTDDVFELKANNAGLKKVTSNYVILIQDDMIIKENDFDKRMLKPFTNFSDVFAVTSQTAHNNIINGDYLVVSDAADKKMNYPRNKFAVREIANRGPLMYNYSDVVSLNFFDEFLCPNSYDDHDISYRAFEKFNKISGLYWIDYQSEPEWGTGRKKNQDIHRNAHIRNMAVVKERHGHLMNGKIKNEDRILI